MGGPQAPGRRDAPVRDLGGCGAFAPEHHLPGLTEGHVHARLADRLGECTAVRVETPETNIVMINHVRDTDTADAVVPRLAAAGLLVAPFGTKRLRAVTQLDVARPEIERAAGNMRAVLL